MIFSDINLNSELITCWFVIQFEAFTTKELMNQKFSAV
jgi:hypothetical protein